MIQEQTRSATIYQFPVGGRGNQHGLRDAQRPAVVTLPGSSALGSGESWYHAEAIRDAQQATTRCT